MPWCHNWSYLGLCFLDLVRVYFSVFPSLHYYCAHIRRNLAGVPQGKTHTTCLLYDQGARKGAQGPLT